MINIENLENIGNFTDLHLGLHRGSEKWFNINLDFAKWCESEYRKRGVKDIIINGDIFHYREDVTLPTLHVCNLFFEIFKDYNITIITGNHDCYYKDNSLINSISILSEKYKIHVVDTEIEYFEKDGIKMGFLPWGKTIDDCEKCDIIFAHAELAGFKMNGFKICEHGETSSSVLEKCNLFISGHFHHKDIKQYGSNKSIAYIGSAFQMDFGDVGTERGIYILNAKNNSLEFIENLISPKHIKLYLSSIIEEGINEAQIKNNIVNLVVDVKYEDFNELQKHLLKIETLEPFIFTWDYDDTIRNITYIDATSELNKIDQLGIESSIEEYCDFLTHENKEDVKKYCVELYNKMK